MTGVGELRGRWARSPRLLVGLVLVAIVTLVGGITVLSSPMAHGQVPVPSARSDLPAVPGLSAAVVTQPSDGADAVGPLEPARVTVSDGLLDTVALTNPEGKQVAGRLSPDRTNWTATEPLGYGKTYTWSGTATGMDHLPRTISGSFRTVRPERLVSGRFNTAENATYGVAMPITLTFSSKIIDKAAVQRALSVRLSVPTEGSWAWLSDTTAHWRPKNYFTPGTRVTVTAKLYGVSMGGGAFGAQDIATAFTVGRSYVLRGDTRTHRLLAYLNGAQVADYPASYGLDSDPGRTSHSGTHVVMEKYPVFYMSNPQYHYKDVEARWAVRISSNGEFIHAAPWSVAQQGRTNVSHGCVNLSPANAKTVFDTVLTGDPVEIIGSPRPLGSRDGEYYDWTIPWEAWTAKSALR